MAVMAGTRSGEDPRRIVHTLMGPSREDARQGGQSRGRSRSLVRSAGSIAVASTNHPVLLTGDRYIIKIWQINGMIGQDHEWCRVERGPCGSTDSVRNRPTI